MLCKDSGKVVMAEFFLREVWGRMYEMLFSDVWNVAFADLQLFVHLKAILCTGVFRTPRLPLSCLK